MKNYLSDKMLKDLNFQRFDYPSDIDEEMIGLMDVFNNIPGCRTKYCCCGHGSSGWYFTVSCSSVEVENQICYYFSKHGYSICLGDNSYEIDRGLEFFKERTVSVYNDGLGKLRLEERFAEYKKIVKRFLLFVPKKHW